MIFIVAVALIIPALILRAYVITILWSWFVASTFSIPTPSVTIMMGILFMIALVNIKYEKKSEVDKLTLEEKRDNVTQMLGVHLLGPLIILGLAWLIKFFAGI